MMKHLVPALLVVACAAAPLSAAELQLSIRDGLVSLDAQDVTIRQILTEWERIGKTRIINAERISGGPVTLKLERVPEKQALDVVLRTVPGYMAVPRTAVVADASVYDRILIMPTTTAVAASTARPAQTATVGSRLANLAAIASGANVTQLRPPPPPAPVQGGQAEPPDSADDQADDPAIAAAAAAGLVVVPAQNPGPTPAPGTSPFAPLIQPQPPRQAPEAPEAAAPANPWNAPTGTSRPTLAPPPPAPGAQPQIRPRPPEPDR